jgi:hypothetical protein
VHLRLQEAQHLVPAQHAVAADVQLLELVAHVLDAVGVVHLSAHGQLELLDVHVPAAVAVEVVEDGLLLQVGQVHA